MRHTPRLAAVLALLLCFAATPASAQRVAPAGISMERPRAPIGQQFPRGQQARELSRYVGWGMAVGATGGLIHAAATQWGEPDGLRVLLTVLGETGLGAVIGGAIGATAYILRAASRP